MLRTIKYLWVAEADAKASGCTHESTLFGVPGYSHADANDTENGFFFVPKFYPANLYIWLADKTYEFFANTMTDEDGFIVTPFVEIRTL